MSVSAHLQKHNKNDSGFTEYFIVVLYKGNQWGIRKRYSDFVAFDEYLVNSGYVVEYKLPQKNFWSRFDNNLIEQRMLELQQYVCFLCHVVAMLHIEWCIMEL